MVTSYISSEAGSEQGSVIVDNTVLTKLIINDLSDRGTPACLAPSAACAAEVEHVAEPEVVPSAACAAEVEHVPSLRRAVEIEIFATAKANMAKKAGKAEKASKKKPANLYGYLPISAVFIDADQKKKDGDKDSGDVVV